MKLEDGGAMGSHTVVPILPEFPNDETQSETPIVDPKITQAANALGVGIMGSLNRDLNLALGLEPGSHEEKVVLASRKYADACTEHMRAQREVAKFREELNVATGLQEKAAHEREAARTELQALLVAPQEVAQ